MYVIDEHFISVNEVHRTALVMYVLEILEDKGLLPLIVRTYETFD